MDSKKFIHERIPHRDPFLWVDTITEISDNHLIAKKTISSELDIFKGHYPQYPIMPGVILCEAIFQAGAILLSEIMMREQKGEMSKVQENLPVLTRIQNAKFKREVYPGDTIIIDVVFSEKVSNAWFLKGKILVNDKIAVKVNYACTLHEGERK